MSAREAGVDLTAVAGSGP
ncbi:MAG: hypothetical protein ACPG8Q_03185, partial [Candidatus Poseidoniaceae archaeon]